MQLNATLQQGKEKDRYFLLPLNLLPTLFLSANLILMPTPLKKISLAFILIFSFFIFRFLSPTPARASSQFIDAMTAPGMNLQKYIIGEDVIMPGGTQGMISTLINGVTVLAVGARDKDGKIISQGATGNLFTLMDQMYQRPAVSSKDYLAYYGNRLNLATPAYAQGGGFDFIKPIIEIWVICRNIAYLFFVVIFVIIGFMIMFRSKLNPQTVISIQLALPKIIISLILVTFSFAICGFIVDVAYLGNNLIYSIFHDKLVAIISAINPAASPFWNGDATPVNLISAAGFGSNLTTAFDALLHISTSGPALLLNLVIAITVLSVSFKIFFNMLTAYIALLLITIVSPFALLTGAIPAGNQSPFNIFKSILSSALIFPATYFMTNLALFFSAYAGIAGTNFKDIDPFRITTFLSTNPQIAMASLASLLSLGVLMTAAQIPQIINQALKAESPLGAGTGEQVGGALRKIPLIGGLLG
ncbi:MAG: hypothetical protein NTZ93_04195 [Candidatus Beckwithbacteria bacterium]|nr:hypothetical protein [Candidatus Beckwithbacteria bacterium]